LLALSLIKPSVVLTILFLKTIQPLSKLNSESKDLTFFQDQLASGENHGERRNTINLGSDMYIVCPIG
jgi:hypothetical protein